MTHSTLTPPSATAPGPAALTASPVSARLVPALFALGFGALLVFGTGFAHPEVIHNAAHDVRHAFAFPCH